MEVLVSTVKPVLEEQAEKLRERGYKAELEEYFEGPLRPYIELKLTLQSQKSLAPSSLRLLDYPEGKIRAVERIMFPEGGYTKEHHMVPQEEVTEEWVKERAVSFIRAVLEKY